VLYNAEERTDQMTYDPVKALQAAGVFGDSLPETVKQAMAGLSQDEVDVIISAHTAKSDVSQMAAWMAPAAAPMQGSVAMRCACGVWSGSGAGAQQ
jgi:hypothetical protein